jgi:hypothetical protein
MVSSHFDKPGRGSEGRNGEVGGGEGHFFTARGIVIVLVKTPEELTSLRL